MRSISKWLEETQRPAWQNTSNRIKCRRLGLITCEDVLAHDGNEVDTDHWTSLEMLLRKSPTILPYKLTSSTQSVDYYNDAVKQFHTRESSHAV